MAVDFPLVGKAALKYVSRGWAVFPIWWVKDGVCGCGNKKCGSPGKHPLGKLVPKGVLDASKEVRVVSEWWTQYPQANVGLACGEISGFWVLDVDGQSGEESLAQLIIANGPVPDTTEQRTGKGRHFLFKYAKGLSNQVGLDPGLDIRTDGGYIVAAPSIHYSGNKYEWDPSRHPAEVPPAEAPEWLLKVVRAAGRKPEAKRREETGPFPEGRRNDGLFRVALKLRKAGLTGAALEAAVIVENEQRCVPPLDSREVQDIIRKVMARAPADIRIGRALDPEPLVAAAAPPATAPGAPPVASKPSEMDGLKGACFENQRYTDDRPVIRITPHLDLMVDAAEEILLRSGVEIFKRGNALVRVARAGKKKREGEKFNRAVDAPFLDLLPTESLGEILSRVGRWEKWFKKEEEWKHSSVPEEVPKCLMARGSWRIRNIESISTSPFMRPNGTVCETPGYDLETEVLYEPFGEYDRVPTKPTLEDAHKALNKLIEPFEEFRLVRSHDIACIVAAILTIAGRTSIDGPVPAFSATAPTPGSGKGLLVNLISTICLGHAPAVTPWVEDDRDWNNLIVSFGAGGDPVVNIDNVERTLQSESLAAALTAVEYKARKFHSQRTLVVPLRMVWFITGNNLTTRGDLYRRILPIEIDSGTEDPERRRFKKPEEELLEEVSIRRKELLPAALTVLRAHAVAGWPRGKDVAPLGSYGPWDRRVRQAVLWAMGEDPCAGLAKAKHTSDPDLREMRTLLAAWHNTLGEEPFTVKELFAMASQMGNASLLEALCGLNYKKDEPPTAKALGHLLSKNAGRIHDGLRLVNRGETRNKVAIWAVVPTPK